MPREREVRPTAQERERFSIRRNIPDETAYAPNRRTWVGTCPTCGANFYGWTQRSVVRKVVGHESTNPGPHPDHTTHRRGENPGTCLECFRQYAVDEFTTSLFRGRVTIKRDGIVVSIDAVYEDPEPFSALYRNW